MKRLTILITILLIAMLLTGCSGLIDFVQQARDVETITPSDNIITESRDVTGFTKIDMRSFGRVILTQGDSESLTIEGSDNIVPLIRTTVSNDKLTIDTTKNISILNLDIDQVLTFNITVKDLTGLTVSGAGRIQMDDLSTTSFDLIVSGAGDVNIDQFEADQLDVTISGAGSLAIAGQVAQAKIEIPGAGDVRAADLECQSATINISGLGSATVWVIDQLNGTISGAGSVSFYGDPQVDTSRTGVGKFTRLGDK